MGKQYSQELDYLPRTYEWARRQDVRNLKHFLVRWGGEHVTVVGSGGSYSAAHVIAAFREFAHHSVTTCHTPLDFIALLNRLSPKAIFLSAEGKNKDILAGLAASADADIAACAVTLTTRNPLVDLAQASGTPRVFSFEMDWVKDGYLATNSLLATVLLLYRVFFSDEECDAQLAPMFDPGRLRSRRDYIKLVGTAIRSDARTLLVLHTIDATPFAVDLSSKLIESALMPVQATDLRQFAHGQHLQLSVPKNLPAVIIAHSKIDSALAKATGNLLPQTAAPAYLEIDGTSAQDVAVAGLVDAMFLAEALGSRVDYDIGSPDVPEFGRAIHQLDPRPLIVGRAGEATLIDLAARRKGLAGRPSSSKVSARLRTCASDYLERLKAASIKAIVCDFDGTLCRAEERFDAMGSTLATLLSNLIRSGLTVAIATGRGGSLRDSIAPTLDPDLLQSITVGYYSGALITTLDQVIESPPGDPVFNELEEWLASNAYGGAIGSKAIASRLGQLTIRTGGKDQSDRLLNAIRAWFHRTQRLNWRAFSSGHSVDVLNERTSKRLVVDRLSTQFSISPETEILRIGDCGHENGNDFELLSEGLSLSCDRVSGDLATCWNYGPKGNNQSETTAAYLRSLVPRDGAFRLSESMLLSQHGASLP